jgi:hypothetical protein
MVNTGRLINSDYLVKINVQSEFLNLFQKVT